MSEETQKLEDQNNEADVYEYDMTAPHNIPLEILKGGRTYPVKHYLKPLSNLRWIVFEKEKDSVKKAVSKSQTQVLTPSLKLWDDLIDKLEGYKPSDDIKATTYMMDKVNAVLGLTYNKINTSPELTDNPQDILDAELLLDYEDSTKVELEVMQSGVYITTDHFFRQETQDQMDEYLSIIADTPSPRNLVSRSRASNRKSSAERVIDLYDELHDRHYGYKDGTEVPAWHKVPAVMHFLTEQFNRITK